MHHTLGCKIQLMGNATFFPNPAAFRQWLHKHHSKETELYLGLYKKGSGKVNISWSEAVDEALCYGWIDGRANGIDEESWMIRFTPRKPNSIWSNVNIKKIEALTAAGKMMPAGIAAYEKRKADKIGIYAMEQPPVKLLPAWEKEFKANKIAWGYFNAQAPSYKRIALHWVMSAKQETTRRKRMTELISDSEAGMKIKSQRR
jgi:uncharacterized protein YdeI (YjbR/CyaY-like superfamily)